MQNEWEVRAERERAKEDAPSRESVCFRVCGVYLRDPDVRVRAEPKASVVVELRGRYAVDVVLFMEKKEWRGYVYGHVETVDREIELAMRKGGLVELKSCWEFLHGWKVRGVSVYVDGKRVSGAPVKGYGGG